MPLVSPHNPYRLFKLMTARLVSISLAHLCVQTSSKAHHNFHPFNNCGDPVRNCGDPVCNCGDPVCNCGDPVCNCGDPVCNCDDPVCNTSAFLPSTAFRILHETLSLCVGTKILNKKKIF